MQPAAIEATIPLAQVEAVDARVGTIESVHDVPGSDKLARLIVTFGDHMRFHFRFGARRLVRGAFLHQARERGRRGAFHRVEVEPTGRLTEVHVAVEARND